MRFQDAAVHVRYFTFYAGRLLPVRLVGPLGCETWAYGKIHLLHRYGYGADTDRNSMDWAEIVTPGEEMVLRGRQPPEGGTDAVCRLTQTPLHRNLSQATQQAFPAGPRHTSRLCRPRADQDGWPSGLRQRS